MNNLSSTFSKRAFKIGTRSSPLALAQTNKIVEVLQSKTEGIEYEIMTPEIITNILLHNNLPDTENMSYNKISRVALNINELDIIVHSMKDVSKNLPPEFIIGCICLRDSCEDVVVMRDDLKEKTLEELPNGSIIGTSSLRRIAKLKRKFPQHTLIAIKGDLDKRIYKLDNPNLSLEEGEKPYSALILAKAGIIRLNLQHRISQKLMFDDTFYAVGQGALACQCRFKDFETRELLSLINDEKSSLECIAERSLLQTLNCRASEAISVQSILNESEFTLKACVSNNDGSQCIEKEQSITLPNDLVGIDIKELEEIDDFTCISIWGTDHLFKFRMITCKKLGINVANILKSFGVDDILKANRKGRH